MGIGLNTPQFYNNGGGIDLKSSPTKVAENFSSLCLNMDRSTDGAFRTRNGSSIQNVSAGIPAQMAGAPRTLFLFPYRKSDGTAVDIVCAGTTIKHSLSSPVNAVTGLSGSFPIPDVEFFVTSDDEYAFWGNGVDTNLKFNGTTWTNWSLTQPADPVPADNGVGVLGAGTYTYYYSFARTVAGVIVQEGELSAAGSVIIAANRQIRVNISVSADPQVNARVIYRISPTSAGVAYRLVTVLDNVSLFYDDNILADGTIEAEYDNQAAPTSAVFDEYGGRMYIVDASRPTDVYWSKIGKPWNVPSVNFQIFDGPVRCIKRIFGALVFGTDKSLWILNGDIETSEPKRVSSLIGILNNRCAVGEDFLYIMATNYKVYALKPTDFSQSEMRLDSPISENVEPLISQMNTAFTDGVCMEYSNAAENGKVFISLPISEQINNAILVYNEEQSLAIGGHVWDPWNNIYASAIRQIAIGGDIGIYTGDYNGFLWKIDDPLIFGDGAEENGTATAGGVATISDAAKTWTVNEFVGTRIRIIGGTGAGQVRVVQSNNANQITVSTNWTTQPDSTSEYTVGGYDAYDFSNWKFIAGSYDTLKQLAFLWVNANASGSYPIQLILQADFNQNEGDQIMIPFIISANNSIWGSAVWGSATWGAQAVFQERVRQFLRFRAVRIGFFNNKAGQPFQINGFSVNAQNKQLFK